MLVRVMRCKGRTPDVAAQAMFTEAGGTIGRSSQCTLALPDPERHISRIQAEVTWSGTAFVLTDRGSGNPTLRNGEAVGSGQSVPLTDGDELHVGDYVLRVELPLPRTAPRAGDLAGPFTEMAPTARNLDMAPDHHPLSPLAEPFSQGQRNDALIPDDFDPFGKSFLLPDLMARKPPATAAAAAGQPVQPEESIDALFGLGEATSDPLGIGGPLGQPAVQPNTAASTDPLLSLQSAPLRTDAAMHDYLPEIHTPIPLPTARIDAGANPASRESDNAFRSWESSDGVGSTAINPERQQETPRHPGKSAPARVLAELPETGFGPLPARPPAPSIPSASVNAPVNAPGNAFVNASAEPVAPVAPVASALSGSPAAPLSSTPPASPTSSALLAALLAGAGLREAPRDPVSGKRFELDEQTMERLGSLLRLMAQGVIDLLATRTTLKSEMHASVTVIAAQGNNPLKFSPDGAAALAFLLSADTPRGFMAPEIAVEDAMHDLLAHQIGVLNGMRAALAGILQRFAPQQLETRLAPKSLLAGVIPMNRKAKLWEQFETLYGAVSKEAEDDFESLFSEAFVRAYEEQIAVLKDQALKPAKPGNSGER